MQLADTSSANNPYIRAFQRIEGFWGTLWVHFYLKKSLFFGLLVYLPIVFNDGFKLAEIAFFLLLVFVRPVLLSLVFI